MALKDMKITKAEEKAEKEAHSAEMPMLGNKSGSYPYGLVIRLDNRALKKLGMKTMPAVGKNFTLHANVVVTEARSSVRNGEQTDRNVELQIQKLDLCAGAMEDSIDFDDM